MRRPSGQVTRTDSGREADRDRVRELSRDLTRELGLLVERYRALSEAKLARPFEPGGSRAEAGRSLAQLLADSALGIEERAGASPPAWRQVPRLTVFAVGDQIAVTGSDLLLALAGAAGTDPAWTREGRRATGDIIATALDALHRTRTVI